MIWPLRMLAKCLYWSLLGLAWVLGLVEDAVDWVLVTGGAPPCVDCGRAAEAESDYCEACEECSL